MKQYHYFGHVVGKREGRGWIFAFFFHFPPGSGYGPLKRRMVDVCSLVADVCSLESDVCSPLDMTFFVRYAESLQCRICDVPNHQIMTVWLRA